MTSSIDWIFKLGGEEFTKSTTGGHKIYAIAGAPLGSVPTEWRIKWVVGKANGESTAHGALGKIHGDSGSYVLGAEYPNPIWKIASGASGECIALADFDNAAIQMLGWLSGDIKYLYVKLNKGSKESSSSGDAETRSDGAKLGFKDNSGGNNQWEAALKYSSGGTTKYYAGGADIYDNVQNCMNDIVDKSIWWWHFMLNETTVMVTEIAESW